MIVTVSCVECGEFEFEWEFDAPDPSVGYGGGLSPCFDETACPKCHAPAPGEDAAERQLERMAEDAYDAKIAAAEAKYDAWKDDGGPRYSWEKDEVDWEVKR